MKTGEIAEFLSAELVGDADVEIDRLAAYSTAKNGELAFLESADAAGKTDASCVIVPESWTGSSDRPVIRAKNPKLTFAKLGPKLHPGWVPPNGYWHETAIVAERDKVRADFIGAYVTIGEGTYIGETCAIHDGVRIGKNVSIKKGTVIHANAVIYDNVEIGSDCVIHSGVVIGADGFGYVRDGAAGYVKFPQIGRVVIEDDIEIGANTCIDRGALGETRIGEGTKIDNMVQIAHNVQIGKRVVIASQTGISGSTVIEDDCVIGGQVGFGDHARVLSGAVIGSQAGILPGKIVRPGVWWGTPVQPLEEYKRQNAHLKGIARLKEEVKALKRQIADLIGKKSD
jgi:UDP-3-O-[3-hydroxymyristoyl] glucosamine N-acyltransferase